uniref:Major facilitator superfamily domain-containing protein 6-like isoform X2 n=2 Tax=Hirondellea gigas TaxID=1518452 RepID=A0A6A7G3U5_9CRUS
MDQGGYGQQQGNYDPQQQQQQPEQAGVQLPRETVSRPYVDPNAAGEVDPNEYPAPKESTHKVRGRFDFLEKYCSGVKYELVIAKVFYFFFFSAFGSLFPLMAIYFKQMAMSGAQTGVLIGCRPFVEFLACPFWGSIADKWRKGKVMLLASVLAWIIFTVSVGFVQPPASACITNNGTHEILVHAFGVKEKNGVEDYTPYYDTEEEDLTTVELTSEEDEESDGHPRVKRYTLDFRPPSHVTGKSPVIVNHVANYEKFSDAKDWISPPFSSIVYHEQDVQKVFFLLILLVTLGEFFSSPAITLADHSVLSYLGEEADLYGKQRMFGSLGWGVAMFLVGIALDQATSFPDHPCTPSDKERNYTICFVVFSVLMGCAMITATQFKFDYSSSDEEAVNMQEVSQEPDQYGSAPKPWNEPKIPMLQTKSGREKLEEAVGTLKTRIFAQTTRKRPQWMLVLKEFKTMRCRAFLFVAWWMGFGMGLIFAFLFWHLQDYGGTPTLFGIASVLNHISEIFAYFFSFRLIARIGHVKVLCIGLFCNVLRFLYISWMTNPWLVLPFEFIQGVTHAAVWAALCSYIAHNTPQHLRHQAQGVLQGIHHGIGRGCGAIIGGLFVNYYGTPTVFFGYGVLSLIVLGMFMFLNFYRKEGGFQPDVPLEEDPHQMADEGAALAPHGVPANPIPRAPSSQHLEPQEGGASYGACTTNGMLDVQGNQQQTDGGTSNPFTGGGATNYNVQSIDAPQDQETAAEAPRRNTNPFLDGMQTELLHHTNQSAALGRDAVHGDLSGEPEWPFCRSGPPSAPLSPTETANNLAIKKHFQAYDELVNSSISAKHEQQHTAFSMAEAGDLGTMGVAAY